MQEQTRQRALAGIMAVLLLSLAGVAAAYGDKELTGTVVSLNRDLSYITVRDEVGRTFKIDTRSMNGGRSIDVWNLRTGDRVSASGDWSDRDTFRADRVMTANRPALNRIANGFMGTVENVNRDLKYITVRDAETGESVRVDVRKMDTRRSINVWQLRNGDSVTVHGARAKKRGTYRADYVNFGGEAPMASGYGSTSSNVVMGTVESTHRDLNYVTIRNDATGQTLKIDVRNLDTRRSVNVWRLRTGDRITVNGSWTANRDRFEAEMVNF